MFPVIIKNSCLFFLVCSEYLRSKQFISSLLSKHKNLATLDIPFYFRWRDLLYWRFFWPLEVSYTLITIWIWLLLSNVIFFYLAMKKTNIHNRTIFSLVDKCFCSCLDSLLNTWFTHHNKLNFLSLSIAFNLGLLRTFHSTTSHISQY